MATADLLLVDDSKVMREMIVACLRGMPAVEFTQAGSGLEAIERLSLAPFDLVVLDLNMPDIGGIEVLEFVRSQDKLRSLPILVVTTRGDETSRETVEVALAHVDVARLEPALDERGRRAHRVRLGGVVRDEALGKHAFVHDEQRIGSGP